jgi:hypothetical protein
LFGLEECGCKKMENKGFGQNRMVICHEGHKACSSEEEELGVIVTIPSQRRAEFICILL